MMDTIPLDNEFLARLRPDKKHGGGPIKYSYLWMMIAYMMKEASTAKRRKVGAAIVTQSMGLYTGYNGTYSGNDNNCENNSDQTKDEVYHAEENALNKMLREGVSTKNSLAYITTAPCMKCSKTLLGAGIEHVYYMEEYRCDSGIEFLRKNGVNVCTWEEILRIPFVPMRF
jgi:dCMP deaminase